MIDDITERLISRAADGDTTETEWLELARRASDDPALWRHVAETQRDQLALIAVVGDAAEHADRVKVGSVEQTPRRHGVTGLGLVAWAGWLAAASVAFVWAIGLVDRVNPGPAVGPGPNGHLVQIDSAEDALREYLARGREERSVIRELPTKVLLESRPIEGEGGYELYYLRQILERVVVPDLWELSGREEDGRPTLVRYEQPGGRPM